MAGAARALSRNDDLVTSRNAVAQLALITVGRRSRVAVIEIIEVRHTRLPIEAIKETSLHFATSAQFRVKNAETRKEIEFCSFCTRRPPSAITQ
jgi:hypothetical protein